MTMKFFQKVNMTSETVNSYNRTGLYVVSGSTTAIDSGAFIVTGSLAPNSVYNAFLSGSEIVDINTFYIAAPVALTSKPVYVVDVVKVTDGTINGNVYREGAKTLALQANAGEKVAIRFLDYNDQFILGDGNFVSAPTVGQYATLTAGSLVLTGSAGTGTGFAVRVEQKQFISEGIDANGTGYLCTVVQL